MNNNVRAYTDSIKKHFYLINEKTENLVQITPSERRRRSRFIVLTVTLTTPQKIELYTMKHKDTKSASIEWKCESICNVKSLVRVSCHDSHKRSTNIIEFFLDHLNQIVQSHHFTVLNFGEKCIFVEYLCNLTRQMGLQSIQFDDLPDELISRIHIKTGTNSVSGKSQTASNNDNMTIEEQEEISKKANGSGPRLTIGHQYHPLTEKEERDLNLFLSQLAGDDSTIMDAVSSMNDLKQKLLAIDAANVHSIMSSEEQVGNLVATLNNSIYDLDQLDERMSSYDSILTEVEDIMSSLTNHDALLQLSMENRKNLLSELQNLIKFCSLTPQQKRVLNLSDFDSDASIAECTSVARELQLLINMNFESGLEHMESVSESKRELQKICDSFAQKFASHINNICVTKKMEFDNLLRQSFNNNPQLKITIEQFHHSRWSTLIRYSDLIQWYRECRPTEFALLVENYSDYTRPLYEAEFQRLKETLSIFLKKSAVVSTNANRTTIRSGSFLNVNTNENVRNSQLSVLEPDQGSINSVEMGSRLSSFSNAQSGPRSTVCSSENSGDIMSDFRVKFHAFLKRIRQMFLFEENFCIEYFGFVKSNRSDRIRSISILFANVKKNIDDLFKLLNNFQLSQDINKSNPTSTVFGLSASVLSINANPLTSQTANTLPSIVYCMDMLVLINEEYDNEVKNSVCVNPIWWNWLIEMKRSFDTLIEQYRRHFAAYQCFKKARCGIISVIKDYEYFVEISTNIFRDSSRISDLEKAHVVLLFELINVVERVAAEHGKTPADVVFIENFNCLKSMVRSLKMTALDSIKLELKQRYDHSLSQYVDFQVKQIFPLLDDFILNVDQTIANGSKPDQIPFQFKLNKQAVKRIIDTYTQKELRKSLESISKSVLKHLSPGSGMFDVVWHHVQTECLNRMSHYEQRIEECYADPTLRLHVTRQTMECLLVEISRN